MPGMLSERRRIVNCSSLLRTDRSKYGPSWRLSGERRDQTVDQASELAAGIVFGLTSVTIKPPSLRLARRPSTGSTHLQRPANRSHGIGHRDITQREAALALGVRVAVHDSRQNDPNRVIWQPGQDYRMATPSTSPRQPTRARHGRERVGPERQPAARRSKE
jgi:hypothetical protein